MQTKILTRMGLLLAVLIGLAFAPPMTVGFLGVPIVLQNMGVMLVAMLLPTRSATITIGMLLALAALGLPVLTGGRGGIAVFMGPTAGFMYGWLLTPLAYAGITHYLKQDSWVTKALGMTLGGVLLTELLGAAWLAATTNMTFVPALLSVLIYIPGDLLKMALSVLVVQQLTAVMPALNSK
ncbi:BioY family transporter [Lacticaseibacillus casei]|uniref:Biotin transporter n=2 Tax=Lacticaseibacillus zeae TaxID=57037 RepID=A0A5R8LXK5_LACZE|nr:MULTISPECIES: BioY family transporter [Lacticaseibacillus]MDE3283159.1 BioY family transporter [Lacticaseibacillus casei]OLS09791.1 BioY family transporter [Lacticaseibacillus casei]QVI31322.1 BioY family transporter [Lacticaseibacillus zeae]TLF42092.1 BioY family transporter [Lacticaseibacillus zeae]